MGKVGSYSAVAPLDGTEEVTVKQGTATRRMTTAQLVADLAPPAASVPFTPAGGVAATDVQAAIEELDTEKLAAASYTAADVLAKLLTVDGAGSGLDADLLDGQSSAAFLLASDFIGMVVPTARTTAHTGWLLCFGQNVSRTTYADLFAAIGTDYGVGDGSTTFGLPDLRGRAVAGQDDMGGTSANRLTSPIDGDTLGAAGGTESHTLTVTEMPAHTHSVGRTDLLSASGANYGIPGASSVNSSSAGGGGAHNNVQPTIVLNYMIFAGA
jgi:microcystin-dependent protein